MEKEWKMEDGKCKPFSDQLALYHPRESRRREVHTSTEIRTEMKPSHLFHVSRPDKKKGPKPGSPEKVCTSRAVLIRLSN